VLRLDQSSMRSRVADVAELPSSKKTAREKRMVLDEAEKRRDLPCISIDRADWADMVVTYHIFAASW